jgi:hypothetical protein
MTNAQTTIATENKISTPSQSFVIYRGKCHEVDNNWSFDPNLYALKSRSSGGSTFYAKRDDCRITRKTISTAES